MSRYELAMVCETASLRLVLQTTVIIDVLFIGPKSREYYFILFLTQLENRNKNVVPSFIVELTEILP